MVRDNGNQSQKQQSNKNMPNSLTTIENCQMLEPITIYNDQFPNGNGYPKPKH